jgi:malonyl-CoA decarboxylase
MSRVIIHDPHWCKHKVANGVPNYVSVRRVGNFLIKRVVLLLSAEFRNLGTFATLSPIPGFRRGLEERLAGGNAAFVAEDEADTLREAVSSQPAGTGAARAAGYALAGARLAARAPPARAGRGSGEAVQPGPAVRLRPLSPRRERRSGRRARDPVAHFLLSNGARVERLNLRGDVSEKGWRESAGMMVNYLYDPARSDVYHEDYAEKASGLLRQACATCCALGSRP